MDWKTKMAKFSKLIYRFNAIPISIPADFFTDPDELILKSYGIAKDPEQPNNHENKEQSRKKTLTAQLQNLPKSDSDHDSAVLA